MNPQAANPLVDTFGRVMRDLRVSLTDRCNYRCLYCLPDTEAGQAFLQPPRDRRPSPPLTTRPWQPRGQLLTFEEIVRFVRLVVHLGMTRIRLTGGEPLLRRQVEKLVADLAAIRGLTDLAMTSNGFLFPAKGRVLRDAGLRRVSFSLDSLEPANFRRITGRDALKEVLAAIDLAQELGLHPVKINAVIIRGLNDHEIESLAEFGCRHRLPVRFIEFMPLDSGQAWRSEQVVTGREILQRLQARYALTPVIPEHPAETARRWAYANGRGEVGIIAPVSDAFCGRCSRLRLTADGKIRTCLFSHVEHDARARLRGGISEEALAAYLREVVWGKEAGHRIGQADFTAPARAMNCIGG